MLLLENAIDHWKLLTPMNLQWRQTWPWAHSVQKIVAGRQPRPFDGRSLFVFSDYGGTNKKSSHLTYSYLIFENAPSSWITEIARIRSTYLRDGRRMSFKRMNDRYRQAAIVPFLQAADTLSGHLVTIAVDKRKTLLASGINSLASWQRMHGLGGRWNHKSFEDMTRKCLFFAAMMSVCSRTRSNISWLTDQDQFVANEDRLDDAQKLAARTLTLFHPNKSGIFAMNHAAIDSPDLQFEDLCSVADLAAGMTADVCTELSAAGTWASKERRTLHENAIQRKAALLSDWYGFSGGSLIKTLISIDNEGSKFSVRLVEFE